MSAQPTHPHTPVPDHSPGAIRAALPVNLRGEFEAAYLAALEDARATFSLAAVNETIERWWRRAVLETREAHREAVRTGLRAVAGEHVESLPADIDALRRP